ncbi:MAG: DUF2442 domain-containing protein [Longimicrobiales bacterium]
MIVDMLLRLTEVQPRRPYILRVRFDDGVWMEVDLGDELDGEVFEPLLEPGFFERAFLNPETGTVEWPNGADLAPTFLRDRGTPVE